MYLRDIANELLAYREDDGTTVASSGAIAPGFLQALARTVTQVEQEMRGIAPAAFKRPIGRTLAVGATGSIVVASQVFTGMVPPSEGVTVKIGSALNMAYLNGTAWTLRDPVADGTYTATIYDDCIQLDFANERVLGDVRANGERILMLSHPSQIERYSSPSDFGDVSRWRYDGQVGPVQFCWPENSTDSSSPNVAARLRFYPMPDSPTAINMDVVSAAPERSTDDFSPTATTQIQMPGGLQHSVFMSLLLYKWCRTPWFKPDQNQVGIITQDYKDAVNRLELWKSAVGAQNNLVRY